MAQYARPDSDVTKGNWDDPNGNDNDILYDDIDEETANDSDYIESPDDPSSEMCEVGLSDVTDPESSSGHTIRVRFQAPESGSGQPATIDFTIALMEGATERASWTEQPDPPTTWATVSYTLTTGEADSISNYANLRLRFTANKTGGARTTRIEVSWAEFEVPDAAGSPPILAASRLLNASRSPQAADDTGVSGWIPSNEFIVVAQLDEEIGPWNAQYTLQWRDVTDSGSFADLASSGEIKWGTATDLSNGNAVVIGEKACTNTPAGSTWQDGEEVEGAATCDAINLADEYYTEIHFACNPTDAEYAHEYEFRLWDETNAAVIGTLLATLTISNGLLGNLIAYWPGNESSGDALDAHSNGLDLDDNNTVTSSAGKVYPLARQYTRANGEYHDRPGDDALLSMGDIDFTIASWMLLDDKNEAAPLMTKDTGGSVIGGREYSTQYRSVNDRLRFLVSDDGETITAVDAENLGSPSAGTWYLVIAWHDSVANTISIQVNDGSVDSTGYSTGVIDGDTPFTLGYFSAGDGFYMSGRMGPCMVWKSAPAGGAVLCSAQRSALYNDGSGLAYVDFEQATGAAITKIMSSTLGLSESDLYRNRVVRTIAEMVSLADALARRLWSARAFTETVGISDSVARKAVAVRPMAETVTIAETFVKATFTTIVKLMAETIGLTEAALRRMWSVRLKAETVGTSDSVLRRLWSIRPMSETITLSEAVARRMWSVREIVSTVSISEAAIRRMASIRQIAESIGISDQPLRLARSIRLIAETVSIPEGIVRRMKAIRIKAESISIQDGFIRLGSSVRQMAETVGIIESFLKSLVSGLVKIMAETVGITDAMARIAGFVKMASETISITETAVRRFFSVRIIIATEAISEAAVRRMWSTRQMVSTIGVSDSVLRIDKVLKQMAETVGISDAFVRIQGFVRMMAETISISEAMSRVAGFVKVMAAETIGLTGAAIRRMRSIRQTTETVSLSDAFVKRAWMVRLMTSTVALQEAVVRRMRAVRQMAASVAISEAAILHKRVVKIISETMGLIEGWIKKLTQILREVDVIEFWGPITKEIDMESRFTDEVEFESGITKEVDLDARLK